MKIRSLIELISFLIIISLIIVYYIKYDRENIENIKQERLAIIKKGSSEYPELADLIEDVNNFSIEEYDEFKQKYDWLLFNDVWNAEFLGPLSVNEINI